MLSKKISEPRNQKDYGLGFLDMEVKLQVLRSAARIPEKQIAQIFGWQLIQALPLWAVQNKELNIERGSAL